MIFWLDYGAFRRRIFRALVNTAKRMAMNRMTDERRSLAAAHLGGFRAGAQAEPC